MAGETGAPGIDTQAFAFAGGRAGCLLIHGFSGTPYEMRHLGMCLHARGHTVRGVRLAGHATHAPELLSSRWQDWYGSALDGLRALQRDCDAVFAIGISMGALLALQLAAEVAGAVRGVAVLAPALLLADSRLDRVAPVVRALLPVLPRRCQVIAKRESDIRDPAARAAHPRFPMPLRGMVELVALRRVVRAALPAIRQPVLILHGRHDRTCPLESAEVARREIGSTMVRYRILEHSAHVITVDAEKDQVADEVAGFVDDVLRAGAT